MTRNVHARARTRWGAAITIVALTLAGITAAAPASAAPLSALYTSEEPAPVVPDAPVAPTEEAPVDESPVEEAPAGEQEPAAPAPEETPVEETPAPTEEQPTEAAPTEEQPTEAAPAQELPSPESPAAPAEQPLLAAETVVAASAPVLSVSPSTGLDRAGDTVTVTGSGYDPTKAVYVAVCEDRALSAVTFDMFYGCLGARQVTPTPSSPSSVQMGADGTFSFELAVPAGATAFAAPTVFTIRNHVNMADRTQDAKFGIAFAPIPQPVPTLSVNPSTELDRAGDTVTVSGVNYDPTKAIYVAICEDRDLSAVAFSMLYGCLGARQVSPTPSSGTVVQMGADGSFSFELAVPAGATAFASPAVFTIRNHVDQADRTQDAKFGIAFAAPVALAPTLTVSPSTGLDRAGDTVTVSGVNYDPAKAIYVAICEDRALSAVTFDMFYGCLGARQVTPTPSSPSSVQMGADGSFSFELAVPAGATAFASPAVFTIRNHVDQADRTQDAKFLIGFAPVDPGNPTDPGTNPGNPGTPGNPGSPSGPSVGLSVSPNSVDRTAANTFSISGSGYTGAGAANGVYVSVGSSSVWQPGQVPSQGGWLSTVWVQPGSLVNGSFSTTITIPANTFVAGGSYGVATFAAHGLSITDRSLDAWSPISLGGAALASSAASSTSTREPADAPPATEGITGSGTAIEGGTFTATAEGFQPNESGILVVLYSTPTVLERNATADANGVVRWTGTLPYGLTGEHTLTFQGSVTRGLVLDIAAAEQAGCAVDDAALTWGFKESFRSYISGSIANGEWTVADGASYQTPNFGWSDGAGSYDAETGEGLVSFDGSIAFTGHNGALNTTVASPLVKFVDESTAILLLDVTGTTQEGQPIDLVSVEFATIDLAAAEIVDGVYTLTAAPTALTAAGATAFGTYPEGEALDPITLTFAVDAECAQPASMTEESGAVEPASSSADLGWLLWVLGGVLLAALVVWLVIARVRRRRA